MFSRISSPYLSFILEKSIISNSIIQSNTVVSDSNYKNSMLGNHVVIKGKAQEVSVGDYNEIQ